MTPTQALRPLPQLHNGLALIAAKVLTMGLGFGFWVLAAREYSQHEVGIAAGVVSAMMLCTQLALLGAGSAFITHFPEEQRRPGPLVDTSLIFVSALGTVWGAAFLLVAGWAFRQLNVVAVRPLFAVLFVAACVAGTLGILFDQMATALRRGDQALTRNAACAVATLALLATLALAGAPRRAETVFLPWAVAGLAACVMGVAQLRRALPSYRPRAVVQRRLVRRLVHSGLPNYALTLAERAPGLILPVIVAELLSPDANATWYAAWMMAWVVYIVPIQVGMTIFAEVAHDPASFQRSVRRGVVCSLTIATAGALVLGVGAHVALSILGPRYAQEGVEPLRILLLAVLPLTFVQAYFSSCRARRRLGEAIAAGWLNAIASVAAAAVAGVTHGLVGMAVAWGVVQYATGLWALWRLRLVNVSMTSSEASLAAPATSVSP
ncbi:MAG TPA: oligosaccharide flippase family protein [Solirubrobacteraceae bacterium]|jgi:O-antigen/teichoic acid export membrane protein